MKKYAALLLMFVPMFVFLAASAFAQSHADVVQTVKTTLTNQHVDLSGSCGAFDITKHVAWLLKGEGAGLLVKTSGNNCEGYATDIIAYPDGRIFDILIDGGASNGPSWNPDGTVDPSRYHVAIDPGDAPGPPQPSPTPTPTPAPTVDLAPILQRLDTIEQDIRALSQESGAQRDALNNMYNQLNVDDSRLFKLEGKFIATKCVARADLGFAKIPVSCSLQ